MQPYTLIIPEKFDIERDAVAHVWQKNYGPVLRLDRFWQPPSINTKTAKLYGNDSFCLVLAQILKLKLISPDDELIFNLQQQWLGRKIFLSTLGKAKTLAFPHFIKPITPKLFKADIYDDLPTLNNACKNLPDDTKILCSDIIHIQAEARAFIQNGQVLTCAIYEGDMQEIEQAHHFVQSLLNDALDIFPCTCVIDVAQLNSGEWVFLETNATWGAGLNSCDPEAVAQCIVQATLS